ncbi:Ribosome biogenesis protein Slx9-like [Abeliophyllum distichum]|uniref:Ribosome biogenesis protein Slx9-like n=1 Tax=Abeliophyllum distichum TaxID=126358 RepID=A0ABD1PCP1_9LAMI
MQLNVYVLHRQLWVYEAILKVGQQFVEKIENHIPRMLSWKTTKQSQAQTYERVVTKLDDIVGDVVELQDALPQAQVDAKNDEAEDTDADVNDEDSEKKMRSKDSLDRTPQQDQMHEPNQEVIHSLQRNILHQSSTTQYRLAMTLRCIPSK